MDTSLPITSEIAGLIAQNKRLCTKYETVCSAVEELNQRLNAGNEGLTEDVNEGGTMDTSSPITSEIAELVAENKRLCSAFEEANANNNSEGKVQIVCKCSIS